MSFTDCKAARIPSAAGFMNEQWKGALAGESVSEYELYCLMTVHCATHDTGKSAAREAIPESRKNSLARMMPSRLPASTTCADELKLAISTVPSLPL